MPKSKRLTLTWAERVAIAEHLAAGVLDARESVDYWRRNEGDPRSADAVVSYERKARERFDLLGKIAGDIRAPEKWLERPVPLERRVR